MVSDITSRSRVQELNFESRVMESEDELLNEQKLREVERSLKKKQRELKAKEANSSKKKSSQMVMEQYRKRKEQIVFNEVGAFGSAKKKLNKKQSSTNATLR